jgi:hypothetical protein
MIRGLYLIIGLKLPPLRFPATHTTAFSIIAEDAQVATLSANGVTHARNLIALAAENVGKEHVITAEESGAEFDITESKGENTSHSYPEK